MADTRELLKEAMTLKPAEKAKLVEKLLLSLDEPSAELDKLWADESEDRIDAYEQGKMKAVTLDKVLEKYK